MNMKMGRNRASEFLNTLKRLLQKKGPAKRGCLWNLSGAFVFYLSTELCLLITDVFLFTAMH